MMLLKKTHPMFFAALVLLSCENSPAPPGPDQNNLPVQGTWLGKIDSAEIFVTLIEGSFEGSATVSGSAYVGVRDHSSIFLVMGGTRTQNDSVVFSLYDTSLQGPADFLLSGAVSHDTLSGFYQHYQGNQVTNRGSWFARRIP